MVAGMLIFGASTQTTLLLQRGVWWQLLLPALALILGIIVTNYGLPLLPWVKRVDTFDARLRNDAAFFAREFGVATPHVYVFPSRFGPAAFTTGVTVGRSVIFIRADTYASNRAASSVAHEIRHLAQRNDHLYVMATLLPVAAAVGYTVASVLTAVVGAGGSPFVASIGGGFAGLTAAGLFALFAYLRRQGELDAYATMVPIDGRRYVLATYGGPRDKTALGLLFSQYPTYDELESYLDDPDNITFDS